MSKRTREIPPRTLWKLCRAGTRANPVMTGFVPAYEGEATHVCSLTERGLHAPIIELTCEAKVIGFREGGVTLVHFSTNGCMEKQKLLALQERLILLGLVSEYWAVTQRIDPLGLLIQFDVPVRVLASEDHHDLFIDHEIRGPWSKCALLLWALFDAGLIRERFLHSSLRRRGILLPIR